MAHLNLVTAVTAGELRPARPVYLYVPTAAPNRASQACAPVYRGAPDLVSAVVSQWRESA